MINKIFKLSEFYRFIPRYSVSKGIETKGLGSTILITYLGLKTKAESNKVQISYQELSDYVGISKSAVQRAVYELEKAELIRRDPPEWKTATPIYTINIGN